MFVSAFAFFLLVSGGMMLIGGLCLYIFRKKDRVAGALMGVMGLVLIFSSVFLVNNPRLGEVMPKEIKLIK